ncbi:MAG: sugar-binding protein [Gemmataceae bacterium]
MRLYPFVRWSLLALVVMGLTSCSRSNKPTVAFISNNAEEFWTIARHGAERAAAEEDVNLAFRMPADGSASEQRAIIEDLLVKGVKGIAISVKNPKDQAEFLRSVAAQVPLLTQDNDLAAEDTSIRRCYIGTNNYEAGRAAGELVKKAIPNGGKVRIFVGSRDDLNAIERQQGVLDVLAGMKDAPGEPVVDGRRYGPYHVLPTMTDDSKAEKCRANVDDTLVKHPDIACLVGLWEYNPPAMLLSVEAHKKQGQIALVAFDENEETLRGIKEGSIIGTVVQDPYKFGYESVKILAALARGDESVLRRDDMDEQKRIFIPHRVITKDNVEQFHAELNQLKGK